MERPPASRWPLRRARHSVGRLFSRWLEARVFAGRRVANVWRVPILSDRPATWADAQPLTSERAFIETLDVSPDGELLAMSSDRRGNQDLWLLPVAGGQMTPLTTDPTPDWHPSWSPNGSEIVFYAYRSGNRDIWVMPARGGPARPLASDPAQMGFRVGRPTVRKSRFNRRDSGEPEEHGSCRPRVARLVNSPQEAAAPSGPQREDGWSWLVRTGSIGLRRHGGEPASVVFRALCDGTSLLCRREIYLLQCDGGPQRESRPLETVVG